MKVAKYEKLRLVDKENKRQKTRQNQTKNPKETHSEQTKTKERKREKKEKLPSQPYPFFRMIFHVLFTSFLYQNLLSTNHLRY